MRAAALLAAAAACAHAGAQGLTLRDALAYGRVHSPELRARRADVEAARAEARAAKGQTLPQLSASAWAARGDMPNTLRSAMGVEPAAMVRAPEGGFADANLMLMAPLFTGGVLAGRVAAAAARADAARAEADDAGAEVALQIREAYLRALVGAELVATQTARVRAAEEMAANARAQLEAGRGIEATVQRAEAELAEARRGLASAENGRDKAVLDLLEAMGAPMDRPVTLADSLESVPARPTLEDSLAAADARRGELQAARRRLQARRGDADSAAGALRPQVYGFAMGDAFSPRDAMGRQSGFTYGLVVSLPLLDGGARAADAASARAGVARAEADVARVRLRVEKEVRQAWLDLGTADANLTSAEAELAAAQAAYDVVALRFETGKSILVEQLDALASLTRARSNRAMALYDVRLALARLDRAIGDADPKEIETR